jgi:hypothetical protein
MLELMGTQKQLLYDLNAAANLFALSLEVGKLLQTQKLSQSASEAEDEETSSDDESLIFNTVDVKLKLAAIHLEKCEDDKVQGVLNDAISSVDTYGLLPGDGVV